MAKRGQKYISGAKRVAGKATNAYRGFQAASKGKAVLSKKAERGFAMNKATTSVGQPARPMGPYKQMIGRKMPNRNRLKTQAQKMLGGRR